MKASCLMLFPISCLCFFTISCNGGSSPPAGSGEHEAPKNIAEALKAAEKAGIIPTLNRDDTVMGPDANHDGVRDDIEIYISSLSDTPNQKLALRQTSAAISNAMLTDTTDKIAITSASTSIVNAVDCLFDRYDDDTAANNKLLEIEKFTVNTRVRVNAYLKYNSAVSGTALRLPDGGGCDK